MDQRKREEDEKNLRAWTAHGQMRRRQRQREKKVSEENHDRDEFKVKVDVEYKLLSCSFRLRLRRLLQQFIPWSSVCTIFSIWVHSMSFISRLYNFMFMIHDQHPIENGTEIETGPKNRSFSVALCNFYRLKSTHTEHWIINTLYFISVLYSLSFK